MTIRREMKGRDAVELVIGHAKALHRKDRSCLKGRGGNRINAALVAAGYDFSLLHIWFAALLCTLIAAHRRAHLGHAFHSLKIRQRCFFHRRLSLNRAECQPANQVLLHKENEDKDWEALDNRRCRHLRPKPPGMSDECRQHCR